MRENNPYLCQLKIILLLISLNSVMKVIIIGAGAIGAHLADLFSKIKQDIVIIDEDEEKLERIQAYSDLMTLHSSSNTPIQALKDAGVNHADLFIAVTRDENLNLSLCVLAKSMGARQTVAKVENAEFIDVQLTGKAQNYQASLDNMGAVITAFSY